MNEHMQLNPAADQIGFAFVKPGFEEIHDALVADFSEHGLEVAHEKRLILPEPAFEFIYRDSVDKHFYADMKHYLSTHAVIAMMITHPEENAQSLLLDLKHGYNGRPNLRDKYRPKDRRWVTKEEIVLWNQGVHPDQYKTTVTLTQANAFHTADDTMDALLTLHAIKENVGHFITPGDVKTNKLGWLATVVDLGEIMDSIRRQLKSRTWKSGAAVEQEDQHLPVNQVYVWISTADEKIAIVSKDGKKWQLPGGKPDKGETFLETAAREVFEETGLRTSPDDPNYKFFGYYDIIETDERDQEDRYLQLRYSLRLNQNSDEITLHAGNEDEEQMELEQVRFVEFVTPRELIARIPWAKESQEMQGAFLSSRDK